jgi:adenosylmethionine-8-amino-7-oxononanoate aminotransferase
MPEVRDALQRMNREILSARQSKITLLKLVHGYGSTGAGGDIRIAVQKQLVEMEQNGQIRGCIFGEDWSKSNETTWKLLQSNYELKSDLDLGRGNRGITIVMI